MDDLTAAERAYFRQARQLGVDDHAAQQALDRAVWDIADGRVTETDPYQVALTHLADKPAAGT